MRPQSSDYSPALWVPASSANYQIANRENDFPIEYIVIHTIQGSYDSAINWFQNPIAEVSAHYVIRASDGEVTQMVRDKDIAWHAGNATYNARSIGLEHEGYIENHSWNTEALYRSSAQLVRHITACYGIPRDRSHIIGHNEVPGADHTDPGACWDWDYYMQLVNPATPWFVIIDNGTVGSFRASENWGYSAWNSGRYGNDYRYILPAPISDAAYYRANIPVTGIYHIYMWYPAHSGYNPTTPVIIWQANQAGAGTTPVTRYVNQQADGGVWKYLGSYRLLQGDREVIAVSRWTANSGYVIADTFKIVQA